MPKNKKHNSDSIGSVVELLALLPWWLCLIAAVAVFTYLHDQSQAARATLSVSSTDPAVGLHAPINVLVYYGFQVGKVLATGILVAAAGISYLARAKRRQLIEMAHATRSLDAMTWQEFELLVGEAFRLQGYTVKELGGNGPDGGVDLVLIKDGRRHLVQCKQWKTYVVGVDVVRQIFGVMAAEGAASCFVVTSGKFTQAALDFAKGQKITLIDGPKLMDMIVQVRRGKTASSSYCHDANASLTRREQSPSPSPVHHSPSCPVCDGQMIRRKPRHGGHPFWGCSGYPSCRGTRNIDS